MQAVEIQKVGFGYGDSTLLRDISFALHPGEALVITGSSGCGKSILLEICAGIRRPTSGRVLWDGVDVTQIPQSTLMLTRSEVGFVFQHNALISNFTVFHNVALPVQYHLHLSERDASDRVLEQLRKFELLDLKDKLPEVLSAGQAKKAALARALVLEPMVLFLDELTAGLDPNSIDLILTTLESIRMKRKIIMLLMSHSSIVALQLRCPYAVLQNGELLWNEHLDSSNREI